MHTTMYVHVYVCVKECVLAVYIILHNDYYVQISGSDVVMANGKQRTCCDLDSLLGQCLSRTFGCDK